MQPPLPGWRQKAWRQSLATYRFSAQVISRAQGRCATASAAYRAAQRIEDDRTGLAFDFTRKGGVLHTEIIAPPGTPDWMLDRAQLWNGVEKAEKRRDAQLAREVQLSLPHELTSEQRLEMLRGFVQEAFVERGMIADVAVHAPDPRGDERNHHAHVMLTMRNLAGDGFGKKERAWNEKEQLQSWRIEWADALNRSLERAGLEERVDHRSHADRGIDREPEPKQGAVATKREREGLGSHAGDDRRAAQERNAALDRIERDHEAVTREIEQLQRELAREAANDNRSVPEPKPDKPRSRSPLEEAAEKLAPRDQSERRQLAEQQRSAADREHEKLAQHHQSQRNQLEAQQRQQALNEAAEREAQARAERAGLSGWVKGLWRGLGDLVNPAAARRREAEQRRRFEAAEQARRARDAEQRRRLEVRQAAENARLGDALSEREDRAVRDLESQQLVRRQGLAKQLDRQRSRLFQQDREPPEKTDRIKQRERDERFREQQEREQDDWDLER